MARWWLICIPLFAYSDRSTDVYAIRNPIRDSDDAIKATGNTTTSLAPAINTRSLQRRDAIKAAENATAIAAGINTRLLQRRDLFALHNTNLERPRKST